MESYAIKMLKEEVRGTQRGKGSGEICYKDVKSGSEGYPEKEREWRGLL